MAQSGTRIRVRPGTLADIDACWNWRIRSSRPTTVRAARSGGSAAARLYSIAVGRPGEGIAERMSAACDGRIGLAAGGEDSPRGVHRVQTPSELIDIAVRAARLIGDGFYGVDLKQIDHGVVVMEVNGNPNLEHGIEDAVTKDDVWVRVLKWFIDRFEQ
jgi:hypothetical protein